jgi:hypothetical protein
MTPQNTDGRDKRIDRIGGDTFADTFFLANYSTEWPCRAERIDLLGG